MFGRWINYSGGWVRGECGGGRWRLCGPIRDSAHYANSMSDFGLLTGQCLPILIVSGKVGLQVPILPTFTRPTAMLCQLDVLTIVRNISTPTDSSIPRR